jgi:gliding motility-associated-like protein
MGRIRTFLPFLFSLTAFVCFQLYLKAQSTFLKTYGTASSEYGTSLFSTSDQGFALTSTLPDPVSQDIEVVLFKTDRNGNQDWAKSYGLDPKNVPVRVLQAPDNGYYLLFSTWTNFNPADLSAVLVRTDVEGDVIWCRKLSYSSSDIPVDLELDTDILYVICTSNYNIGAYPGVLIHKLDTSGNWQWTNHYTSSYQVTAVSAALDGYGRLAICGNTNSYGPGIPINTNNFLMILDSSGAVHNTTITGKFYSDEPKSLIWQQGSWIFSSLGYTLTGEYDISIQRFDSLGNFSSSRLYDATTQADAWEDARDIIPLPDGSIVMTGDAGKFEERNIMLAKIDPLGGIEWAVQYPVSPMFTNYGMQVVRTPEQGFALTGDMRPPAYFRDAFIIKTDSMGNIPCYTIPLNFTISPDSLEVSNATIVRNSVQPVIQSPALVAGNPAYPEKMVCEFVPPLATFTFSIDSICPETCFNFTDSSINAVDTWDWTFSGGLPSTYSGKYPPAVCYPEPGTYEVSLNVNNADGNSTFSRMIRVEREKCDTLFIPNVITPNGDGKNDIFSIRGLPEQFQLQIYNRWGNLLFETKDSKKLWKAEEVAQGVYYYLLELYSAAGRESHRGTVMVLKEG